MRGPWIDLRLAEGCSAQGDPTSPPALPTVSFTLACSSGSGLAFLPGITKGKQSFDDLDARLGGIERIQACMSKRGEDNLTASAAKAEGALCVYAAPWKAHLLVACRKCQKKLKSSHEAAHLKKALKRRAKADPAGLRLRVLPVPCLKLCPKDGVTVCTQRQLGRGECSIVRTADDLDALYAQFHEEAGRAG